LRRAAQPPSGSSFQFGDVHMDFSRHEVARAGQVIDVTPNEFRLLRVLIEHRGALLSIDQLIQLVWGPDIFLTDRVIYTHINNLRAKIEPEPKEPRYIVSVRGAGYRFDG